MTHKLLLPLLVFVFVFVCLGRVLTHLTTALIIEIKDGIPLKNNNFRDNHKLTGDLSWFRNKD